MDKSTFIVLLALVFAGGGIYAYSYNGQTMGVKDSPALGQIEQIKDVALPAATSTMEQASSTEIAGVVASHIVVYGNSGFSPTPLTIKKGETVVFENKSSRNMWVASAMHPSHRAYPETDIEKCGTGDAEDMFDACKGFGPGTSWSFTFDDVGVWKYHDHLNAKNFGSITVE